MSKQVTGKVNAVFAESVLINIGQENSLTVPTASFKQTPEKYQIIDFKVDAMGHKVKKDASGKVVYRSKNIYAAGFSVIKMHDTGMEIEELSVEASPASPAASVDYNEPV